MSDSPIQRDPDEFGLNLDLDSARVARAEVQPAPTVTIGGRALTLPAELPLDVLDPLTTLNVDISLLIRQVLDARSGESENAGAEVASAVIDMLIVNPTLPTDVVGAVKEMTRRLFGQDGYDHLAAMRLTLPDIGVLAKWVIRRYGVGLGEASRSSDSSADSGTTSKPTSRGAAGTSGTSGGRRRTPAF